MDPKDLTKDNLIHSLLALYAYRVDRDDAAGLVKSMVLALASQFGLGNGECAQTDEIDGAMCAIYWRNRGVDDSEYEPSLLKLAPEFATTFRRCPQCRAWGKRSHTLNCSILKELER